jgi:hypothetical protein
MSFLMARWFVGYIVCINQICLSWHTYIDVSHGWRNLEGGGKSGRKCVWILALALTNWTPLWKQGIKNFSMFFFFNLSSLVLIIKLSFPHFIFPWFILNWFEICDCTFYLVWTFWFRFQGLLGSYQFSWIFSIDLGSAMAHLI